MGSELLLQSWGALRRVGLGVSSERRQDRLCHRRNPLGIWACLQVRPEVGFKTEAAPVMISHCSSAFRRIWALERGGGLSSVIAQDG